MRNKIITFLAGLCLLGCQTGAGVVDNKTSRVDKLADGISIEESELQALDVTCKHYSIHDLTTIFYFEYDSDSIDEINRKLMHSLAQYLKEHPKHKILIVGHSHLNGPHEYNQALGQRRANAVKDYLAIQGVCKSQMRAISRGKENPVSLGDTEQAQSINRRVEIFFEKPSK